jgi:hypothetical protein
LEYLCMSKLRTVRGSSNYTSILQGEEAWLDVSEYDDIAFYLNVQNVTGTVTLTYQTSPLKDGDSFLSIGLPITLAAGARVDVVRARAAFPAIARYVRWLMTGSGTFDVTFSIDVAVR